MSASDLIAEFGFPATIVRFDVGAWVSGHYVPGATTNIPTTISIQPVPGIELLKLPEGERPKNMAIGYCADALFSAKIAPSKKADRIIDDDGVTWEVQDVKPWKSFNSPIAPHWEVVLAEVNK